MTTANDMAEVLTRCRATLVTALQDTPEDLADPVRTSTLEKRIEEIGVVLKAARAKGISRDDKTRQKKYA